jgi:thiamine-monophosphate kinase
MDEFELIRRFFQRPAPAASAGVVLGIGDDAALLDVPLGSDLVAAVDTLVAGRHFPHVTRAHSIGHRALAVNLSDIAAMGATPLWATLALTLPCADEHWLEEFSAGLLELAAVHGVSLVGGDTTRGPLTVSLQILGHVPHGRALRRGGAQPGDLVVVSGTLGDAGAGLACVLTPPSAALLEATAAMPGAAAAQDRRAVEALIRRFDYPEARIELGVAARGIASAAMDLSDGLAGDLPKMARASGLSARVAIERLPLSDSLLRVAGLAKARDLALCAGDDYELLLAVPPARIDALHAAGRRLNLTLSVIGEFAHGSDVTWSLNGMDFAPSAAGYDHFAQASTQITV